MSQNISNFDLYCELQHGCFNAAAGVFDSSCSRAEGAEGATCTVEEILSEPSEHWAVNQSQHSLEAQQGNQSMSVQYAQLLIDKFVATGDTVLHGS